MQVIMVIIIMKFVITPQPVTVVPADAHAAEGAGAAVESQPRNPNKPLRDNEKERLVLYEC
jgi:hypothetical protein